MNFMNLKYFMNNGLFDQELVKLIGVEVTQDWLIEQNVFTIADYRKLVSEDAGKKNEKARKNRKGEASKNKSKSKMKMELRKRETLLNKKLKNQMRGQILESLEKHKHTSEAIDFELLSSAKNLGKKRKAGKKEDVVDVDVDVVDVDNLLDVDDVDDSDSEDSLSSRDDNTQSNQSNQNNKMNNITIPATTLAQIQEEKIQSRLTQGLLLDMDDEDAQTTDSLSLCMPPKSSVVTVTRDHLIQEERIKLPIVKYEHEIMDKINNSLVTVICGETGSGKSTQIPQFLYEYGYSRALGGIIVTQPRRVAAISLATRVASELNSKLGETVGYQVRYDSQHCSKDTAIKFVTDGILLKEMESDKLLLKYSVVMIDEAHERTLNTDIIIGLLSKLVRARYLMSKNSVRVQNSSDSVTPLRLVIMSATMRVDEFISSSIFRPYTPSFIKVEARQFPVTIHHSKRTPEDYLEETFKLCCKVHKKLPMGGVLVFLTGRKEIEDMCRRLKEEFTKLESDHESEEEDALIDIEGEEHALGYKPVTILPLYSSLPQEQQLKIFDAVPLDSRLIVIATNVAETSLTIPNIRYVIDSGKQKVREFKSGLSFSTFQVEWVSQASAQQRSGRAGRTGPGYCYRLYSNGLYAKMEQYLQPQIVSSPLDAMILYLKSLNIKDISKFPFLTFPKKRFVEKTLRHLIVIGALKQDEDSDFSLVRNAVDSEEVDYKDNTLITDIGKLMVKFPVAPKYAKMLILANKLEMLKYAIVLVAVLNVDSLYNPETDKSKKDHSGSRCPSSDVLTLMNLVLPLLQHASNISGTHSYCYKHGMNEKKVKEMLDIISQLVKISKDVFNLDKSDMSMFVNLTPVTENYLLMQVLLAGLIDNLARRRVVYDKTGNELGDSLKRRVVYECNENNEECKLHAESVVFKSNPEFIMYKEIIKAGDKGVLMMNTVVKPEWVYHLGGELISASLIKDSLINEPYYSEAEDTLNCYVDLKYGYKNWEMPKVRVRMNVGDDYVRYFARFLLEGKILKEFIGYEKYLNAKPKTITSQISILPKVTMLLNSLKFAKVHSREDLVNMWKKRKDFLRDAYLNWIDDSKVREKIRGKWPFNK